MLITRITYGRTVQVRQYEPEKIEIDFVPSGDEKPDDAVGNAIQFVDRHFANISNARNGNGAVAPKSTAPPLKETEKPAKKKRGRPPKKKTATKSAKDSTDHPPADAEAKEDLDRAQDLEQLVAVFNGLRDNRELFRLEQWEQVLDHLRERYRDLNSMDADDDARELLIAAAKAERDYIANQKLSEAA